MKIAVEGCSHGELDKIYETLEYLEKKENTKVDLLLCCGDFQAVRNSMDLSCMAVPSKYRKMETFYKYYSGEKKAPVLTIFIGGNHEASNHLWELPFGGWVAPNIYYLGYSGVVNYGGIRIAGLSGIFKGHDYNKGHFEKPPYNDSTLRSAYHIRSFDVFKFTLISQPIDIFMSHDWPQGVYHHGNLEKLFRFKDFLRSEIESNTLGSPPAGELLALLQPEYWFSAHLHVKFPALVPHESQDSLKFTKFLALDKCLPRREFLQVVDVGPAKGPFELSFDPEWLAITKLTSELSNATPAYTILPKSEAEVAKFKPDQTAVEEVAKMFENQLKIPENFVITTAPYDPAEPKKNKFGPVMPVNNPQTEQFCRILGITNQCYPDHEVTMCSTNPEEISLSDDDDVNMAENSAIQGNPDEIGVESDIEGVDIDLDNNDNDDEVSSNKDDSGQSTLLHSRPRLNLPKPTNKAVAEGGDDVGDVADVSPVGAEASENPATDYTSEDHSGKEPERKVMKLVRRNQSLYTSNDDEENDD